MGPRTRRLTPEEAAAFIVRRWVLEHSPEAIMISLVMLRVSCKTADVLKVIRRYCDINSENTTYGKKR